MFECDVGTSTFFVGTVEASAKKAAVVANIVIGDSGTGLYGTIST